MPISASRRGPKIRSTTIKTIDHFGWVRVGREYVLESYTQLFEPGIVSWRGSLRKPDGWEASGKRHRVVIREFEFFETDEDTIEQVPVFNPGGIPLRERLVYADTFELT